MNPVPKFAGFPVSALDFYEDLEDDNSKAFWASHKAIYDADVRAPMVSLLAALEPEFGAGKIFRPYRDVRFSKNKAPYKTHQGAYVAAAPSVGWYVQIDASGLFVAGGFYGGTSEQVSALRKTLDDDKRGRDLENAVTALVGQGYEIGGDKLKTRPRGVPEDHPRLGLMRHKSLTVSRAYVSPDWLTTTRTLDMVRQDWRAFQPLIGRLAASTVT
ncbi:DUF2461 domain-containing protein [Hoyosella subflava]|uniref:TIGR02453 family protein n=1 Tax=Hoyosella subflava (strain DSM 45089 / JCM 17490 / NBRC 109087 / DQS3-9A1) TaxID=443218 RepID=F6EH63_HOYSD|nr:DUF2461 domain-containing protein [Hoyosella subflava]AEF39900.1 hypothetical protein AS9A_1448 [Hoyosella subflava DQS3-9A1]